MHDFLIDVNNETHASDKGFLLESVIATRTLKYLQIIADGEKECPAIEPKPDTKRKPKQGKSRNLLIRLKNYKNEVLLFMSDPFVPFTNNQGERDLRMLKVQQKISGCFKTIDTAKQFCRIRSYLSTCKKNNVSVTEALELLFDDKLPRFIQDMLDYS